jgi:hypothetical protein
MLDDQQFINMGKTLEGSFSTTKSTHNILLSACQMRLQQQPGVGQIPTAEISLVIYFVQ